MGPLVCERGAIFYGSNMKGSPFWFIKGPKGLDLGPVRSLPVKKTD